VNSRKSRWIVALLALPLCLAGQQAVSQGETHKSSGDTKPVSVGMVALLATPQKYEGKIVRTVGFMCVEFENDALYLHEEDYHHGLHQNSFALRLSQSQRKEFKGLSLKYVLIEGTVYANGPEQTDMRSGAIGNITRLEVWPADYGPDPRK
jgi:hypothetical protein